MDVQKNEGLIEAEVAKLDERESVVEQNRVDPSIYYAGFWMRFWAYVLDIIVIGSLNRLVIKPIFQVLDISREGGILSPYAITTAIVFYLYFILMTKICSQTLGKMVFGLKVVHIKGEQLSWPVIVFRELVGRYISKTLLFIGYLLVAFLPKNQGLHDYFAETTVIHENRG
ncbi:RDD family protein [Metabacillus iocasae]|uniref:RDD family membrane protein YckC n=1 Tax=Priestia iocasae TaxID=2291674 RepID=A0ABS2QR29_9BACI|nr:RDD family protein [Metabacillus iocasae]MBM7701206.1 putative RDD family membrane protein YckC [Metabacillus iocasae]